MEDPLVDVVQSAFVTGSMGARRGLKSSKDTLAEGERQPELEFLAVAVVFVVSLGLFSCAFLRLRKLRMKLTMERLELRLHRRYRVRETEGRVRETEGVHEDPTTKIMSKSKLPCLGRQQNRPKPDCQLEFQEDTASTLEEELPATTSQTRNSKTKQKSAMRLPCLGRQQNRPKPDCQLEFQEDTASTLEEEVPTTTSQTRNSKTKLKSAMRLPCLGRQQNRPKPDCQVEFHENTASTLEEEVPATTSQTRNSKTKLKSAMRLPCLGRQKNQPKPLYQLEGVPETTSKTMTKTKSLPLEDSDGYTEVKILPGDIQIQGASALRKATSLPLEGSDGGYSVAKIHRTNVVQGVGADGYTDVELQPDGVKVTSPHPFSRGSPNEYNTLGKGLVPPGGNSKPHAPCLAYNHVVLHPPQQAGSAVTKAAGNDDFKQPGNEYDVSVLATEARRVMVIGEVYDRLAKKRNQSR